LLIGEAIPPVRAAILMHLGGRASSIHAVFQFQFGARTAKSSLNRR